MEHNGTVLIDRNDTQQPFSIAAHPVYSELGAYSKDLGGFLYSVVQWEYYLESLIPEGVRGIVVVLRNSCGQERTYELTSDKVRHESC